MNILDAFIIQNKKLNIVISCLDITLLKELVINLISDFTAELIDLTNDFNVTNVYSACQNNVKLF